MVAVVTMVDAVFVFASLSRAAQSVVRVLVVLQFAEAREGPSRYRGVPP